LLSPHRPAVDQADAFDPKVLANQALLQAHIVPVAKPEAIFPQATGWIVAGGSGKAIAQHIGNEDKPPLRVEDAVGTNQPLQVGMLSPIGGGVEDQVVFSGGKESRRWRRRA
jgi:hypothetical protein